MVKYLKYLGSKGNKCYSLWEKGKIKEILFHLLALMYRKCGRVLQLVRGEENRDG